ncbi:hypothetical protein [Tuwongella immobilis]|uniref:Repeat-companion domain protein n=1 Tax=Tuwongella immobilis TaxID=692036 RepID=A0A6C2YVA1_9BACT|nr:hypothetical protein [Tuwongella immobilis]VIP05426.1 unnamed protein product [Tuwongella immobilis]VTS08208.1 unnamed protein product [Tuwongella immobilis]
MLVDSVQGSLMTACTLTDDGDRAPWLMLADWLEENGEPEAAILRHWAMVSIDLHDRSHALSEWCGQRSGMSPNYRYVNFIEMNRGLWRFRYGPRRTQPLPLTPPNWPTELELVLTESTRRNQQLLQDYHQWLEVPWVQICLEGDPGDISPTLWTNHLANQPYIRKVRFTNRESAPQSVLNRLVELPNLHTVDFVGGYRFEDSELDLLRRLPGLRTLRIARLSSGLREWSLWGELAANCPLHSLELSDWPDGMGREIAPFLAGFPLIRLVLNGNVAPMLLPYLQSFRKLRELRLLSDCRGRGTAWLPIASLPDLECLELVMPARTNIRPMLDQLASHRKLRCLTIRNFHGDPGLTFSPWGASTTLEELHLTTAVPEPIQNLGMIVEIPNLKRLVWNDETFTEAQIAGIRSWRR